MAGDGGVYARVPCRVDFAGGWSDVPEFSAREGGAVLNAAVAHYIEGSARWDSGGLRLEQRMELPPRSHLGTSASASVAYLRLVHGLIGKPRTTTQIAEDAFRLAELLGLKGGKQDEYAAAFGGIHYMRFGAEDAPAQVEPLAISPIAQRDLESRCVVCDTRGTSISSELHDQVWARYREGEEMVARTLREMRDSAAEARGALMRGDYATLADMVTLNREGARRLLPAVITPRMDELFELGARAGALGSKPCGGGGGGFVLFVCAEGAKPAVEAALIAHGAQPFPFVLAPFTDAR